MTAPTFAPAAPAPAKAKAPRKAKAPAPEKVYVKVSQKIIDAQAEVARANQMIADAKIIKEQNEPIVKEAMNGADYGTFHGAIVIKRQNGANVSCDWEILLAGWPEAHAAAYTKTPYFYYKGQ